MRCGLYGKLPAKRDFIAIGAPREFLNVWEPWLQGGLSASRVQLAQGWQDAFLTSPIWRFWLGAGLCGTTIMGAFMPSLDGVGRYFPLTLFFCADNGATVPPPEYGPQDGWFDTVETFLMSTLDQGAQFETMTAQLAALPPPAQEFLKNHELLKNHEILKAGDLIPEDLIPWHSAPPGEPEPAGEPVSGKEPGGEDPGKDLPRSGCTANGVWAQRAGESFSALFGSIRGRDYARIYAGSTFWWTIGGDGIAPVALSGKGMPDPFQFSAMLTGKFAADPA
jgi:type VI secretion system protein ImpM